MCDVITWLVKLVIVMNNSVNNYSLLYQDLQLLKIPFTWRFSEGVNLNIDY